MLPFFLRAGVGSCAGLGWRKGLILGITGGVPLTVISNIGLNYAPAAHASAIQPGMVAVTATTLAYLGMRARIPAGAAIGFAIVLSGLAAIAIAGSTGLQGAMTLFGDALFVLCGIGWGVFTWLCGRWMVPSVHRRGGRLCSVGGDLPAGLCPVAVAGIGGRLLAHHPVHGINQGILNIAIGLLLWTYGTRTLGVAVAARFPPMIPVLGTLIGIPALGEVPSPLARAGRCRHRHRPARRGHCRHGSPIAFSAG